MTSQFQVSVADSDLKSIVDKGGDPLKDLCRKEAFAFSDWLRENEPNFQDGLADWERQAIAVYLYKKVRGLDEPEEAEAGDLPEEGQDG